VGAQARECQGRGGRVAPRECLLEVEVAFGLGAGVTLAAVGLHDSRRTITGGPRSLLQRTRAAAAGSRHHGWMTMLKAGEVVSIRLPARGSKASAW
jgi:hypothetical protein